MALLAKRLADRARSLRMPWLGRVMYGLAQVLFFVSCTSADQSIQDAYAVFVDKRDPTLTTVNGIWMRNGVAFSGYVLEREGNQLLAKLSIRQGKENGVAYGWYKTGRKRYERGFVNGNREGVHKGWYENGRLSFLYFFHNDKYEGEQTTFFESGHRWNTLHYVNGYEEGQQQAWNDRGRLVTNFTVKNGKLYGVIGRFDCMSVYKK